MLTWAFECLRQIVSTLSRDNSTPEKRLPGLAEWRSKTPGVRVKAIAHGTCSIRDKKEEGKKNYWLLEFMIMKGKGKKKNARNSYTLSINILEEDPTIYLCESR